MTSHAQAAERQACEQWKDHSILHEAQALERTGRKGKTQDCSGMHAAAKRAKHSSACAAVTTIADSKISAATPTRSVFAALICDAHTASNKRRSVHIQGKYRWRRATRLKQLLFKSTHRDMPLKCLCSVKRKLPAQVGRHNCTALLLAIGNHWRGEVARDDFLLPNAVADPISNQPPDHPSDAARLLLLLCGLFR
jgi:hypothetical protein